MMTYFIYFIVYLFIGELVCLLNWLYVINNKRKSETNVLVYFYVGIFVWPLMLIGMIIEKTLNIINNDKHKD